MHRDVFHFVLKMISSRLMAFAPYISPRTKATPVSKGAIFAGGFSCRNRFLGTMMVSHHQKKKVELAKFDSFRISGVGEDEDDQTCANQRTEELESSLNGMNKWLVGGLFAVAIIWKRDAVTVWSAMGTFLNSILSTTLKKIFNQERPSSVLRTDPGMPSSHAQHIFYAVVFLIHSVMEFMGVNLSSVVVGAIIFICGAYLSWLRVSHQFHTISQVLVGAALGSTFSLTWLWKWRLFVLRAFDSSIAVQAIMFVGAATYYVVLLFSVIKHQLQD